MDALARAIPNERGLFLFSTIDRVRERGILAPVFYDSAGNAIAVEERFFVSQVLVPGAISLKITWPIKEKTKSNKHSLPLP